jgi:hypothetical protein
MRRNEILSLHISLRLPQDRLTEVAMPSSTSQTSKLAGPSLSDLRLQISAINHEILVLLNRRAEIGLNVLDF